VTVEVAEIQALIAKSTHPCLGARPIGRNNWIFTGSDDASKRLATVAKLCATCRHLGVDPWRYLRDVFQAIADGVSSTALVKDFTPWAWAENEAKKANAQKVAAVG
jgi:hypothetical protein